MTTGVLCPTPILAFILPNGQPNAGGTVLTQVSSVNTPTYSDVGLTTALPNPIPLNSYGQPANAAGQTQQVFLTPNTVYTFTVYDRNGNQVNQATYVNGVQLSITQAAVGQALWPQTAAEFAASVIPTNYFYAPGTVDRYGTNTTPGTTDMTAAWNAAIAQASQTGGAPITANGKYLIVGGTPLVLNTNGIKVTGSGMGATQLLAGANGIGVLKVAQSNISVTDLLIDGNGFSNVDGLVLAPSNEAVTNVTNFNSYNTFRSLQIQNCNNGIRTRPGPSVASVDSGCYYNVFQGVYILNCVRGIWMQNAVNNGNAGANRCTYLGVRIGSAGNVCNTGVQIDNATTCQFFGLHCDGINNGVSPSASPTAWVINNAAGSGADNNDNFLFGCVNEANTLDLNNTNPTTQIYGGLFSSAKFATGNVNPTVMVTGDPSNMAFILPGMINGQGLSGYPSGIWGMSEEIADYVSNSGVITQYNWQAYALSTGIMTNVASIASGSNSQYRKFCNMVEWDFVFQFDATSGTTQLTITPPIAPNAMYTSLTSTNPFYTFSVANGSGTIFTVAAGWTSAGKLFIAAPSGNWNTGGNNNEVYCSVRYHT